MRGGWLNWRRSAGLRFGFAYAILFGFSTIAVVAVVWWLTAGELDRETTAEIRSDVENLDRTLRQDGISGLQEAVTERVNRDVQDEGVYKLAGPGIIQTGNVFGWPKEITDDVEWIRLRLPVWGGEPVMALVHHFTLTTPQGVYHLLVGRDVHTQTLLWDKLSKAVPWIITLMTLLGIFGAVTVRRLFVTMLGDVSATAAAITAGDLSSRVALTGRGDEFDELAETINDMLDRISRLMDGVREVSNAIAHDLRTPIARARARLEDAARESTTEEELRSAVERAIADLDGVTSVFHALLRIAEIEAGARRSAFAPLDLTPLLRDLGELYEASSEEGGRHLELDVPASLPTFGDRDMLQQAVANLLDNALKFSPPGTTVRIAAMRLPHQALTVTVSDEGPGIPEADRTRAVERFFRGESARSTPGSGLGLALVQAVANLHGGLLRLEDNAPGLRAVLVLPLSAPPLMDRVSHPPQNSAIPLPAE